MQAGVLSLGRSHAYRPAHAPLEQLQERKRRKRPHFALGAIGGLGAAAAALGLVVGTGAFSLFSGSVAPSTSQPVNTGTVVVQFGTASGTGNELTVGASNVAPGDTISRGVTLENTGNVDLSEVAFQVALASGSSANPLSEATSTTSGGTATAANELQLEIQSCPSPGWTATSLSDGGYSYSCSGTATTVLASTPVSTLMSDTTTPPVSGSGSESGVALTGLNSLTAGGTDYLVATLTLPSSVPNDVYAGTTETSMQDLSTAFDYTFVGTQVAGSPQ